MFLLFIQLFHENIDKISVIHSIILWKHREYFSCWFNYLMKKIVKDSVIHSIILWKHRECLSYSFNYLMKKIEKDSVCWKIEKDSVIRSISHWINEQITERFSMFQLFIQLYVEKIRECYSSPFNYFMKKYRMFQFFVQLFYEMSYDRKTASENAYQYLAQVL